MKHPLCLICVIGLLVVGLAAAALGETMSVQVKAGELRSTPSFLGKILSRLPYGTQVAVSGERGDWLRVSGGGTRGWMHRSALSQKKIVFRSGAANVDQYATSDELSLAGKGFNEEVEAAYKARNPGADFAWIDRMEAVTVSQSEMIRFLQAGQVSP
jgi:uncharacterized protein YraI